MRSLFVAVILLFATMLSATAKDLVAPEGFVVYTTQKGDTWESVFPDERYRELAMKVNRMNVELSAGRQILKPMNAIAFGFTPMPERISDKSTRAMVFDLNTQYFGYYEGGSLAYWGPISTGKSDNTPTGTFTAQYKQKRKYSDKYGSRMDFAVQVSGDYFFHEQQLPGYPASKGCLRMLWDDAEHIFGKIRVGDPIHIVRSAANLGA
jgi:lipoprotein-anchoring transpeptidase ErfK/SrfK